MNTVLWFQVSSDLSNRDIGRRLGSAEPESDTAKDLVLFRRGNSGVACRSCPTFLKVFVSAPDIISAAQKSFGLEVGES